MIEQYQMQWMEMYLYCGDKIHAATAFAINFIAC
jgi:hypothetical protein